MLDHAVDNVSEVGKHSVFVVKKDDQCLSSEDNVSKTDWGAIRSETLYILSDRSTAVSK